MAKKTVASIALAVTLLTASANPVRAETHATVTMLAFQTGQQLLDLCHTTSPSCQGYAIAVSDLANIVNTRGSNVETARVCVPLGVRGRAVRDVVVQYLEAHPERRNYSAAYLTLEALAATSPCKLW